MVTPGGESLTLTIADEVKSATEEDLGTLRLLLENERPWTSALVLDSLNTPPVNLGSLAKTTPGRQIGILADKNSGVVTDGDVVDDENDVKVLWPEGEVREEPAPWSTLSPFIGKYSSRERKEVLVTAEGIIGRRIPWRAE